jgi:acetyltransferase-like isoleucine patch superfamily enzyme
MSFLHALRKLPTLCREWSRRSYPVWWWRQNTDPTANVRAWVDRVGNGTKCKFGFQATHAKNVVIGRNVELNNAKLISHGSITIEDDVFFGYDCQVLAATHDPFLKGRARADKSMPLSVTIKSGAWIASGAILVGNCTIGRDAVVSAGAVVMGDVPDNCIAAGNPAEIIQEI